MKPDFTRLYGRWKSCTPRKEDMKVPFPKPTIRVDVSLTDEHELCTPSQLELIQDCASLIFNIGEFKSLADILNALGVQVIIKPEIIKKDEKFLNKAKKYWEAKLNNQKDVDKASKALIEINNEREYWKVTRLRGRYLPKEKIIELFPEEMKQEVKEDIELKSDDEKERRFESLLISTLAHEVMHAYFDRPGHDVFPYAYFVEEPLAEFGMLLYLQETCMPADFQNWAQGDVAKKHSCYRYGANIFDQYTSGDKSLRKYLEDYKCGVGEYEMLDMDASGRITLPRPIVVASTSVRFYFESESKWTTGNRLYFHINNISKYDDFKYAYSSSGRIILTFEDKLYSNTFIGDASIYISRKNIFPLGVLKDKYLSAFGEISGIHFAFYEKKTCDGVNPAEWVAREL